jgi:hypothetical protein
VDFDVSLFLKYLTKTGNNVAQLDNLSDNCSPRNHLPPKTCRSHELKQSILQKAFTGELTADTPKTVKEKIAA